jgi:hypothetical protein
MQSKSKTIILALLFVTALGHRVHSQAAEATTNNPSLRLVVNKQAQLLSDLEETASKRIKAKYEEFSKEKLKLIITIDPEGETLCRFYYHSGRGKKAWSIKLLRNGEFEPPRESIVRDAIFITPEKP